MPEEKKEKKSIFPIFGSSAKEEKKDSFTFSDKIKNSKTAAPSFANRISSKIGSNGRPKKTLFERTKRDAPFFIAALVALLLLPFLYKYSGQVNEEPVIAPSSEETAFDPERYGFDTAVTDPDGQIAQLSARDPLSLIKGFGSGEDDASSAGDSMEDYDRSGLGDSSSGAAYSPSGSNTETTTNIYRRKAAPATRAAFRRSATKIKEMGRAPMASAGGGLNVTPWGGSLKGAAKKVSASGPRNAPKPVSLQPLQAAGKPSRGYFGMNNAALARHSKEAMTKANAMQALRDAQFAPINPGRIGGLTGTGGRHGGGASDLKHGINFNSLKPWWWDLMKTRSQMEWEKKFNRKWNWIDWGDKLAQNILGGVINCLLTGDDGGGMGSMWGTSTDTATPETCKCAKNPYMDVNELAKFLGIQVGPKTTLKALCQIEPAKKSGCSYEKKNGGGGNLNWYQKRLNCMGATVKGKGGADIKLIGNNIGECKDFKSAKVYDFHLSGKASGWKAYHMVVAKNVSPINKNRKLCGFNSTLQYNKGTSAGVEDVDADASLQETLALIEKEEQTCAQYAKKTDEESKAKFKECSTKLYKWRKSLQKPRHNQRETQGNDYARLAKRSGLTQGRYNYEGINTNSTQHDCVIYVATGSTFVWNKFREETVLLMAHLRGSEATTMDALEKDQNAYNQAVRDFAALDLSYIQGFAAKQSLAVDGALQANGGLLPNLPMIYWDFQRSYLERTKGRAAGYEKGVDKVYKRKERKSGQILFADKCDFEALSVVGEKIQNNSPEALLTISEGEKASDYTVGAVLKYNDGKVTLPVPESDIEFLGNAKDTEGKEIPNVYRYKVKNAAALLAKNKDLYADAFDANGNLKPEYDLANPNVKQDAVISWTATHKNSGKTAQGVGDKQQEKKEEPASQPIAEVQGEGVAGWTCKTDDVNNEVFMGKGRNSQLLSFNSVLAEAPLYCDECKNAEYKKKLENASAKLAEKIQNNVAVLEKTTEPTKRDEIALTNQKLEGQKSVLDQAAAKMPGGANDKARLTIREYLYIMELLAANHQVPAKNVCYLARSLSWIAADPDVKDPKFPNTFGVFAAYVGENSYLFPQRDTLVVSNKETGATANGKDKRFESNCGKDYKADRTANMHWGYYDHSYWDSADTVNGKPSDEPEFFGFMDQIKENPNKLGVSPFPLASLALYSEGTLSGSRNPSYSVQNGRVIKDGDYDKWSNPGKPGSDNKLTGTKERRNAYHKAYNNVFFKANGCDQYGSQMMDVQSVKDYLSLVCQNTLNFKPHTGYSNCGIDGRRYGKDSVVHSQDEAPQAE